MTLIICCFIFIFGVRCTVYFNRNNNNNHNNNEKKQKKNVKVSLGFSAF